MTYTDKNVPIECSVCSFLTEGLENIEAHILEYHGDEYSPAQAKEYARAWTDGAYETIEQAEYDYTKYMTGR